MTQTQATKILAKIAFGSYGHETELWADIDRTAKTSDRAIERACAAIRFALDQGSQWHWAEAEKYLDRAYAALGSENPGTGYAWHTGQHPIQLAAT